MPIVTTTNRSEDFAEHVGMGKLSAEDIHTCLESFYEAGPTMLELWDMSESEVLLPIDKIRAFVRRGAKLGEQRRGGRTAVVARSKVQYGLGKVAEAFGQFEPLPYAFRVFYHREKALAWLKSPRETES